jgi:glycosyltransferase involved in cell wall biosynthesis
LLSAGFDPRRVHLIPDGVGVAEVCTLDCRLAARAALAAVNEDLRVGFNMPVVSFIGPLEAEYELERLIAAWRSVARDWPHARLWLIGDGASREKLYRRIRDADLYGRVLMPGTFDCHEDVIRASNLVIVSSRAAGPSHALMEAMAAGVPVLVTHGPDHDNLVTDGVTGRVVCDGGPQSLVEVICQTFTDPQQAARLAVAARDHVQRHHSSAEMIRLHYRLFQDLMNSSVRMVP